MSASTEVRLKVSVLAPEVVVQETRASHYLGILDTEILYGEGAKKYGALGGPLSIVQFRFLRELEKRFGVRLDPATSTDLRLMVPADKLVPLMRLLILNIELYSRGAMHEVLLKELASGSPEHPMGMMEPRQVYAIESSFVRWVRQDLPKVEGAEHERVHLILLHRLTVTQETFDVLTGSSIVREFPRDHLPWADRLPTESITLGDGTYRLPSLVRLDEPPPPPKPATA